MEELRNSQRFMLERLGEKMGFQKLDDWYKVSSKDLEQNGAQLITALYGSLPKLLETIYPQHNWISWKFNKVPNGYWNNQENRKKYVDWLGNQLRINKMDDWYGVTSFDFKKNGGSALVCGIYGSPFRLLQEVYPEHQWKVWKFNQVPNGTWNHLQQSQRIELVKSLAKELSIKNLTDWYRVSNKHLSQFVSLGLFSKYPLDSLLPEAYPDYNWDIQRLQARNK